MKWKILASEYLVKYIYFTARRDRCQRADGAIVDPYYVVEMPASATALAITEEGKVILVKQYRHAIQEVIYETPGGFIDEGEDNITGMRRELLEETGYSFPDIEHLGRIAANPGVLTSFTELFIARGGKKVAEQQLDHNEEIEIVPVEMDELIAILQRQELKQSLHTSCVFYALLRMGKLKLT